MKRFFLFLFSLTFLPLMTTTAHAATEFKIVEGLDDQALKEVMEKNVNAMLLAFKTAADEQKKTVKLDKNNLTADAIEGVKEIWKSSAMSCL